MLSVIVPRRYTNPCFHVHNGKRMLRELLENSFKKTAARSCIQRGFMQVTWTVEQRDTLHK